MRSSVLVASIPFVLALSLPGASSAAGIPDRHAAYSGPAPRAPQVLTDRAVARLRQEGTSALWVYFTDKGEDGPRSFERAVRAAGDRVAPAARARRERDNGGFTPDYYDVPVVGVYVEAVRSSGATLRHVSKWLNAVSVEADEATARRIAALPCVAVVTPIARSRAVKPVDTTAPILGTTLEAPRLPAQDQASGLPARKAVEWLPPPGSYGAAVTQLASIQATAAMDSGYTGN